MAEDQQEERTEEPTEKRRREFREKGQVAQSREVNTALLLSAALLLWYFYAPHFWEDLKSFLSFFWRTAGSYTLTSGSVQLLTVQILKEMAFLLWPFLLLCVLIAFLASYIQFGWLLTGKPLQPDLAKLNPIKGASKFFSKRSLMEVAKSLAKVCIVASLAYFTIYSDFKEAIGLVGKEVPQTVLFLGRSMALILLKCCLILVVLAVLDYLFVRWEMEQKMKMTKREQKDEFKETEGDPQVKQKIRSIQKQMAKKRMMAEVPESDVVITNPTRLSIALRYDQQEMEAPQVVAKGSDYLAARIREVAEENDVPVLENPAVARALYEVELGESIPEHMFRAVAEILAYVYRIKGKG